MNRHEKHLNNLFRLAEDIPPVGAARVAAAIVHHNSVISYGFCSYKSDPFQKKFGRNESAIFLHAEIDAIKNSIKRTRDIEFLKDSVLYVARVKRPHGNNKKFIHGSACPCEGCQKAISVFGIKKVIYSLDNEGYENL